MQRGRDLVACISGAPLYAQTCITYVDQNLLGEHCGEKSIWIFYQSTMLSMPKWQGPAIPDVLFRFSKYANNRLI